MKEIEAWNWVFSHIKNRQEGEATFGRFYIYVHGFTEDPKRFAPDALDWERYPEYSAQLTEELKRPIHFGYHVHTLKQFCGAGRWIHKETAEDATQDVIEAVQSCLKQVYREEETQEQLL